MATILGHFIIQQNIIMTSLEAAKATDDVIQEILLWNIVSANWMS